MNQAISPVSRKYTQVAGFENQVVKNDNMI